MDAIERPRNRDSGGSFLKGRYSREAVFTIARMPARIGSEKVKGDSHEWHSD